MKSSKAAILNDPGMRSIYINPDTNDTWKEGDTYTRLNFANTLERIAKLGSEASPCPIMLILSQILSTDTRGYFSRQGSQSRPMESRTDRVFLYPGPPLVP